MNYEHIDHLPVFFLMFYSEKYNSLDDYEWASPSRLIDVLARKILPQRTLYWLAIIDIIFIFKVNVVPSAHTLTGLTIKILLG